MASTGTRPTAAATAAGSLLKPGNIFPAAVWLFLVANQASKSSLPPSLPTALLLFINSVTVVAFMARRDASKVGNYLETLLALSGTFIVAFLDVPPRQQIDPVATVIQVVALTGWAASLLSLGRSFGIVPADRGLVQHGPYRFIRHPIYAFEALFLVGYVVAVPTPRSLVIGVAWVTFAVLRILREERILEGYEGYRRRVRWRLVPGIW